MSNLSALAIQQSGEPVVLQGRRVIAVVSSEFLEEDVGDSNVALRQYTFYCDNADVPDSASVIEYNNKKFNIIATDVDAENIAALIVEEM